MAWFLGCLLSLPGLADGINTLFTPINQLTRVVSIERAFSHTDSITAFGSARSISGLSVSATVVQASPNSMVRIILVDTAGNEFLVGESSRLFNDTDTVRWENYSEETCRLADVYPAKLKIAVRDASVTLQEILMSESGFSMVNTLSFPDAVAHRRQQVERKVAAINAYNQSHDKLWIAGVTELALKPYAQKKNILGLVDDEDDTKGFEYYAGGIYEVGEPSATVSASAQTEDSPYIDNFDWRNRHGINWITPCKHQGGSNMCTFFATTGAVEAIVNLYYNKKLDLDLSEVDLALYGAGRTTYKNAYLSGTYFILPGLQALRNGISDEESIPFIDDPEYNYPQERPQTKERIYIKSYDDVLHSGSVKMPLSKMDSIKKYLIQKGPMVCGFQSGRTNHAMTLVGYRRLELGDSIYYVNNSGYFPNKLWENDHRIGKTCWIFKNSYYGEHMGTNGDGYYYMLFNQDNSMFNPYYINVPIKSRIYTDADIQCTDNDGDGFFFWGIGSKPANFPSWAQDEPDGDDSDYSKGPMDEYGYCLDITPNEKDTIFITQNTMWNNRKYLYQHVVICENASLTITDTTTFYRGCTMTIKGKGRLVVDGGTLSEIILRPVASSFITIKNEGVVTLNKEEDFVLPLGSELEISNGTLQ